MNNDLEKAFLLEELSSNQCRWPLDEGKHYCGDKVIEKSSYCEGHKEISLSKWQPKEKKAPGRLPSERR